MVLTAGIGSRLGSHTQERPKPLLDVDGVPLIDHILLNLARAGFQDVALNLHFRGEMICDHVGDGARFGLRVVYSSEESLLGTAGGVARMSALLGGGPLLVHYGDILTDHDLAALWRRHVDVDAAVTMLVHRRVGSNSIVTLDEQQRVVAFVERPARPEAVEHWVYSGVAVLSPRSVARISTQGPSDLPRDLFVPLVAERAVVVAVPLAGYRFAIDSPTRLEEARAALRARARS